MVSVVLDGDDSQGESHLRSGDGDAFETVVLVDEPRDRTGDRSGVRLRKPASTDEIGAAVERRQRRVAYSRLLERYYAVASEYAGATSSPDSGPDDLATLRERLFTMRERLDEIADALGDVDAFDAALGDREREPSGDE